MKSTAPPEDLAPTTSWDSPVHTQHRSAGGDLPARRHLAAGDGA